MAKSTVNPKMLLVAVVVMIAGFVGFGYYNQASELHDNADKAAAETPSKESKPDAALLEPKPTDIILGDSNALITIVEYSSLSCPHCAHFHEDILPKLQKDFISTGKVKLVMRHFPLNEPAIRAAQLVECAGKNGLKRENFLKVLFSMQQQWAFNEDFQTNLTQIAKVGGLDSTVVEGCFADKDTETSLLASRQEAETKLQVSSTPTFFINGSKYEGEPTIDGFRAAIEAVAGSK